MSEAITQPQQCCHLTISSTHPHSHDAGKSKSTRVMEVLEKISAVALGIFSAYTNIKLFAPFFLLGVGIGVYTHIKHGPKDLEASSGGSACSQEFIEQVTGVKLPAPISLAANIAVTVCHIDHHTTVFVPIVGLAVGNWVGRNIPHYGGLLYRKIEAHLHHKKELALAIA